MYVLIFIYDCTARKLNLKSAYIATRMCTKTRSNILSRPTISWRDTAGMCQCPNIKCHCDKRRQLAMKQSTIDDDEDVGPQTTGDRSRSRRLQSVRGVTTQLAISSCNMQISTIFNHNFALSAALGICSELAA